MISADHKRGDSRKLSEPGGHIRSPHGPDLLARDGRYIGDVVSNDFRKLVCKLGGMNVGMPDWQIEFHERVPANHTRTEEHAKNDPDQLRRHARGQSTGRE